jgi:hypothetical protein
MSLQPSGERITMNTVGPLDSEYREVEKLFFRIAKTSDPEMRTRLFEELADHLADCAAIENRTANHSWASVRTAHTGP